jgi:hypothetical protein
MVFYALMATIFFWITGCASRTVEIDKRVENSLIKPTNVEVYDITSNDLSSDKQNPREQLKHFPFISTKPIIDFKGKFPDTFYQMNPYRFQAENIANVDFWKLRQQPYALDFIYITPMWIKSFQRVSNDLFENIGYTYNLSKKEQEILKWWIEQGGILWCEMGVYTTLYDTFKKDGTISAELAYNLLKEKAYGLKFLDKPVATYMVRGKQIDYVVYVNQEKSFATQAANKFFRDIHHLCLESKNYIDLYYIIKGDVLLKDKSGKPLVTSVKMGKGLIISLLPFDFEKSNCDGELLRWKLLYYSLGKQYRMLPKNLVYQTEDSYETISEQEDVETVVHTPVHVQPKPKAPSLQKGVTNYCIQLYSTIGINDVLAMYQQVDKERAPLSRVEKIGQLYVIRIGNYPHYHDAKKDLTYFMQMGFEDAYIRKCAYKPERIIKQ